MSDKVIVRTSGIGFMGLLFLVLLTLKLTEQITLSWLWVTAPLWIGPALLILGIIGFLLYLVYQVIKDERRVRKIQKERERKENER